MRKGTYMTKTRERIFSYLQNHVHTIVSAKDIHAYFEENGTKINMSTIYRNLDRLEKEGTIIKIMSEDGKTSLYQYEDHEDKGDKHLHLQCLQCGKVIHLDCHFMNEIKEHISSMHDFDIQCKNSVIYGLCNDCQEKNRINK